MFSFGTSHYCALFCRRKTISFAIKLQVGIVNVLIFSHEAMTSSEIVDWKLKKICEVIMVKEIGLLNAKIPRQVNGSLTTSDVSKFCL